MTPEQEALREKVARALCAAADDDWGRSFFSMVASNDTPKTGQEAYRALADAAIAVVLKEALDGIGKVKDGWLNGATVKSMKAGFVEAVFRDFDEAILSLIPQEDGK